MITTNNSLPLRRPFWAAVAAFSVSAVLLSVASAVPAAAESRPVPEASGYVYSAGEPAILGSVGGTAGAYYDAACTGGYAIAGDSGFFLTTSQYCPTFIYTDGSVRGDAGYYGDVYYSNPREVLSLIKMRPGNDAQQDIIDPVTTARPGTGLVIGWTRSVDQPVGYVIGKMGIDTGWTEGKVVGTAQGPDGITLLCTTAPAEAGDIGGPVWRSEGANVRALGTVVGISDRGGACYRPIQETLYEYGASLPSFGAPQGRPSYGRFAPGMPAYTGKIKTYAGRVIDKGDEWR